VITGLGNRQAKAVLDEVKVELQTRLAFDERMPVDVMIEIIRHNHRFAGPIDFFSIARMI
jgi:phosphoenolpyruvate-protein kinase (PTS system EI component)